MNPSTVIIFIVNYNSTKEINRNLKLIYEQNKLTTKLRIIIIDNSLDFVLEDKTLLSDVTILPQENNISRERYGKGSHDHARSLNLYVNDDSYNADFTIVMDPDCYIYGSNWIKKLSKICNERQTCIATPWHPKHEAKLYRSIAVHFMIFQKSINIYYDFNPDFGGVSKLRRSIKFSNRYMRQSKLRKFGSNIKRVIFWGTTKDTGYKLIRNFEKVLFFKPIIFKNEVFWLNKHGNIIWLYWILLMILRGIRLRSKDYIYSQDAAPLTEQFQFGEIKLEHERRSVVKTGDLAQDLDCK